VFDLAASHGRELEPLSRLTGYDQGYRGTIRLLRLQGSLEQILVYGRRHLQTPLSAACRRSDHQ
jgi:hypothetical protein